MRRVVVIAALTSCSVPTKQLASDGAGADHDASLPANLDCLGHSFVDTAPAMIKVMGSVTEAVSNQPVGQVPVAGYLRGTTSQVFSTTSDGTGRFSGTIATSGGAPDLYVTAYAPGLVYVPYTQYPRQPLIQDSTLSFFLLSQQNLAATYYPPGAAYDPSRGTLFLRITDCNGYPIAGAAANIFPPTGTSSGAIYYLHVAQGTLDQNPPTDSSGVVIVDNHPVGVSNVSAMIAQGMLHSYSIEVKANTITAQDIQP
jgi:hypothetical protein